MLGRHPNPKPGSKAFQASGFRALYSQIILEPVLEGRGT